MKREFKIEYKQYEDVNKVKLTIAKERISLKISENIDEERKQRLLNFVCKIEKEYDKLNTDYTVRGFFDSDNFSNELSITMIGGYKDDIVLSVWEN